MMSSTTEAWWEPRKAEIQREEAYKAQSEFRKGKLLNFEPLLICPGLTLRNKILRMANRTHFLRRILLVQ